MKRALIDAKRAEVERLESLARKTLDDNPFDELTSETVEAEWRELAHAIRHLGPLFDAWEKAELGHPDFVEYRGGFDFRLAEAMATIGSMCDYGRIRPLRQQKIGKKDRPNAKSPFHKFIDECLAKNPRATATDIERAFKADEDALDARFEEQGASFVTLEKPVRRMLISSIPAAVSKRRKKILAG